MSGFTCLGGRRAPPLDASERISRPSFGRKERLVCEGHDSAECPSAPASSSVCWRVNSLLDVGEISKVVLREVASDVVQEPVRKVVEGFEFGSFE